MNEQVKIFKDMLEQMVGPNMKSENQGEREAMARILTGDIVDLMVLHPDAVKEILKEVGEEPKTIGDWLNEIEDDTIQINAFNNHDHEFVMGHGKQATTLVGAIFLAFNWMEAPEGYDYWLNVARGL